VLTVIKDQEETRASGCAVARLLAQALRYDVPQRSPGHVYQANRTGNRTFDSALANSMFEG